MNAIAGFVADSLIYGPGYTFTVTAANGAKTNWHEAAQAYLEAAGLSVANASLVYSLGATLTCWMMLWRLWRKKILLKLLRNLSTLSTSAPAPSCRVDPSVSRRGTCDRGIWTKPLAFAADAEGYINIMVWGFNGRFAISSPSGHVTCQFC